MKCRHCDRPMRSGRAHIENFPGTVAHQAHGLCSSCYRHRRTFGTLEGWSPTGDAHRFPSVFDDGSLDRYAALRKQGRTRAECAELMGVTRNTLDKFLERNREDPRSDSLSKAERIEQMRKQSGRRHPGNGGTFNGDPDLAARAADVIRRRCEDAAIVLAMLGLTG